MRNVRTILVIWLGDCQSDRRGKFLLYTGASFYEEDLLTQEKYLVLYVDEMDETAIELVSPSKMRDKNSKSTLRMKCDTVPRIVLEHGKRPYYVFIMQN